MTRRSSNGMLNGYCRQQRYNVFYIVQLLLSFSFLSMDKMNTTSRICLDSLEQSAEYLMNDEMVGLRK
jgi:hypothetical protein